ncbi:MAG: Y-family DNA polymerase, partial [Pseudomonadota bacterium]
MYALVDCNNFFASCERVFNPSLAMRPVAVLSNNDGCIIARSNEVKALGIPMGAPYHQYKQQLLKHKVKIFSSNYQLYGDMSARVMQTLQELWPYVEVYSIDEAFLHLNQQLGGGYHNFAANIVNIVKQWTGIPVSIGIALTKTLAKIANHIAKKQRTNNIMLLTDKKTISHALKSFEVEQIWGISHRLGKKLRELGITTAYHLQQADRRVIRKKFGVVVERTHLELSGYSCLALELPQPRKNIRCSRSFGRLITDYQAISEALSHYCTRACEKARHQQTKATGIYVYLRTNPFKQQLPQYYNSAAIALNEPSYHTPHVIKIA